MDVLVSCITCLAGDSLSRQPKAPSVRLMARLGKCVCACRLTKTFCGCSLNSSCSRVSVKARETRSPG